MQQFIDNWSATLLAPATASAVSLSVEPVKAALLTGLGTGDFYRLTLVEVDAAGTEIDWDVVKVTAAVGGVLTVARTGTARNWVAGTLIEARLTADGMEELRDTAGGAAVGSDMPQALGSAAPGASPQASRQDHVHPAPTPGDIGAATAAQGAKADSAVQPGALAAVATTGAYADLTGKPPIPSAAAEVGAIATTEKGSANGVATLGSDSKIPLAQLPATAITSASVVANEAAMLALTAQEGDVAIRPDINTSFILAAEPASTLSNWQEILAPSVGGGAPIGSSTPQPLGTATPGVSSSASRQDHVHGMPSAADVGADPAGTAAAAVAAHAGTGGAAHANAVAGGAAGFMTGADKTKLDGVAAGATANANTDSLAEGATNKYFTEGRVRSTVLTGLSLLTGGVISATDSMLSALGKLQKQVGDAVTAIGGKQDTLVSGTNIRTVNGSSLLGAGDLVVTGGASLPAIRAISGNETLALANINTFGVNSTTSNYTSTIPAQATVAWTADAELHFLPSNTGDITITAAAGVSLNGVVAGSLTLSTQNGAATLKRIGADSWWLGGVIGTVAEQRAALGLGSISGINRLINGNFQVNQRGVTGTVTLAAGAYGHDRWKAGDNSGCTYTFATTANVTTITITAGSLQQVIEGVNLQSGTHTLSWSGTAQGKIGAGSYGASGITGAAVGGTNLIVEFNTGTLSLAQLEQGSVATPFEHRPYGTELALCQRYYEVGYSAAGARTGDNLAIMLASFKNTKRAVPTMYFSPDAGGAVAVSVVKVDAVEFYNNPGSGSSGRVNWSASAEL